MKISNLTASLKLMALQISTQAVLMAAGASAKEACLVTCLLAALAPMYFAPAMRLYRQAFAR